MPLALVSPPAGAHLLSGLGDIDGFRHDDLGVSPAQGTFAGVRFGNTLDMAFAAKNPAVIVRTGTGNNNAHAAISRDGGKNWEAFAAEPAGSFNGGTIAVSADGKIIVWTARRGAAEFSRDGGTNWVECAGLSSGVRVIADTVNSSRFYAFYSRTGKFLYSTNGAENFFESAAAFSPSESRADGSENFGALAAAPEHEGDVWLALRGDGLYHSADGGADFANVKNVDEAGAIGFGKAADGKDFPAIFLAGKISGVTGVFRSTDAGSNWTRVNDDAHQFGAVTRLTGDPRVFGRVYLATSGRGVICGEGK